MVFQLGGARAPWPLPLATPMVQLVVEFVPPFSTLPTFRRGPHHEIGAAGHWCQNKPHSNTFGCCQTNGLLGLRGVIAPPCFGRVEKHAHALRTLLLRKETTNLLLAATEVFQSKTLHLQYFNLVIGELSLLLTSNCHKKYCGKAA